ncbi:hypothetical protein Agub_g13503, partial [Astrephomene gubernaculifera]
MPSGMQRLALRLVRHATRDVTNSWALSSRLSWLSSATQARYFAAYPAHVVLNMPSLSPTMTQGNITKWRKQPGEQIAPGQILAEVETDKAIIEWEAQEEGYMAKHLVPEGASDIAVGTPVAVLAEEESGVAGLASFVPGKEAPAAAAPASPAPKGQSPPAAAPPRPAAPAAAQPAAAAAAPPSGGRLPPHQVLNMPSLSPTMSQGNILEWKKKVGDPVAPGDVYCEVETDKATISWESQEEGYVARVLAGDGSRDVDVGTPVLVLVEDKEAVAAFANYQPGDDKQQTAAAAPAAAPPAAAAAPPPPPPPP